MRFLTEDERNMKHFNENVRGCKRRRESKPQISYEPGCSIIRCDAEKCACAMNDGDGGPVSEFIARWTAQHGMPRT